MSDNIDEHTSTKTVQNNNNHQDKLPSYQESIDPPPKYQTILKPKSDEIEEINGLLTEIEIREYQQMLNEIVDQTEFMNIEDINL
ncbi:hypothetical protein WICMUC_004616 [Wickerhamomyces mucosus]|uniref:Uncharacterized protein n=1 Tax=Wickerhamomyces mucosus TaxID=1378264 RepID=A0A9P8TAT3_9ASCO|nr:hypothetical protein WICMUC_004616 [Wickerhamomyces mucosus]